ncbi:alpha/beta fold hydrolase [Streptomyces niveiscabiei]|uniref:Alpha/beta fold hydrolase n=1 Tax=Streptomyces niveiscabiei TaxID=164115 RepID=A0ABW9HKM2_9ACTN
MSGSGLSKGAPRRAFLKRATVATAMAAPVGAMALGAPPAAAAGRFADPLVPEPVPQQAPSSDGFVEVPGGRLYVRDTGGTGTPVVFDHAGTGSALAWPYQQPALARAGYRVITYSRRGYYRSSDPASDQQPSSADLLAVADQLGLKRFHLVGAAFGGFVATDFALSYPGRLLSLVSVNSQMGVREPGFTDILTRLLPQAFSGLPDSFREVGAPYRAVNPQGVQAWEEIARQSRPGAGPWPTLRHRITFDLLETIGVRTLLTAGAADLFMPPPLVRMVAGHLPNASVLTFAEAGHSLPWERPSAFNQKLIQFLAGARFPEGSHC